MKLFNFLKGLFIKRKIFPNLCVKTDCPCMGDCCRYAFRFGGYNILTRHACKYLDEKTNLCKIYPKRFEINPNCSNMKIAYRDGNLPEKCPYLQIRPLKKKVKPKIDYYPNDTNKTDRFNHEVFNDSHRDFVRKYFNEHDHIVDCFMRFDDFIKEKDIREIKRGWIQFFQKLDKTLTKFRKIIQCRDWIDLFIRWDKFIKNNKQRKLKKKKIRRLRRFFILHQKHKNIK